MSEQVRVSSRRDGFADMKELSTQSLPTKIAPKSAQTCKSSSRRNDIEGRIDTQSIPTVDDAPKSAQCHSSSSRRDNLADMKDLSTQSLPTKFEVDVDKDPLKPKGQRVRKSRPTSISCTHTREIIEEFRYRPRPSKSADVSSNEENSTSKSRKSRFSFESKKKQKNRLTREYLRGTMAKLTGMTSSSRSLKK